MAIVAGLIALAILSIVGLIFYDEVKDGWDSFMSDQDDDDIAKVFGLTPTGTQEVCSLRLDVYGEIEYLWYSVPVELRFEFGDNTNNPQVVEWKWFGCEGSDSESFSISDYLAQAELQSLISVVDTSYKMNLRLVDSNGNFKELDTRVCCEIGVGVIPTPIEFRETFLVKDIPKNNYDLEITIESQKINNKPTNSPYIYQIRN